MDNIRDKVDALRKMFGQMGAAAGEQVQLSSYFQVQLHSKLYLQGNRHNYIWKGFFLDLAYIRTFVKSNAFLSPYPLKCNF